MHYTFFSGLCQDFRVKKQKKDLHFWSFSVKIRLINSVNPIKDKEREKSKMAEYEDYLKSDGGTLDVREALILAGITELEEKGMDGFSLRRVATACGVSCAAPYKHFKDKDAFFSAIAAYIDEKWSLLEGHISAVVEDEEERLAELCLASVRFWVGNPHFRAVRMLKREGADRTSLGKEAEALLHKLALQRGASEAREKRALLALRSFATSAVLMLEDGILLNTPEAFTVLKEVFKSEIKF